MCPPLPDPTLIVSELFIHFKFGTRDSGRSNNSTDDAPFIYRFVDGLILHFIMPKFFRNIESRTFHYVEFFSEY